MSRRKNPFLGVPMRPTFDRHGKARWRLRRVGTTRPVRNGRAKAKAPVTFVAPSGDSGLYMLDLFVGNYFPDGARVESGIASTAEVLGDG